MKYKIEEIVTLTGARRYGHAEAEVEWLLTDSRSLVYPETSLFFAIKTASGDGHDFIQELYQRGVRNFVVTSLPQNRETVYPDANFLQIPSALKALQRLAERHREQYDIPVIGITGSNGKNMVKEWLNLLLSPTTKTTRSPRSYNSQTGVPLSVWLLDETTQLGIFEAGISQPGEMEALRDIIQPTIGVMVSLGSAHQENFGSMEEKCREKLRLFKDCEILVYCSDDEITDRCVKLGKISHRLLSWSKIDANAPLFIRNINKKGGETEIKYTYNGKTGRYTIPFVDDASINDSIHCLAVCLYLKKTPDEIAKGMQSLEPLAMRLEVTQGINNCTIINDTYNSDVNSLDIALDFMNRRAAETSNRKIVILSDILQSGMESGELYSKVAEMVNSRKPQLFIGVGKEIGKNSNYFKISSKFFNTTEELIESGELNGISGDTVLLKGARKFGFERIYDLLTKKVHETTLNVNLGAIVENLNHYRSFMKHETKIVCMVKASAYGSGALEVSRTLQEHGVDYLAVAVADEGVALRNAGITANIMVMNPEMTAFRTMLQYNLEPEIYSFRSLADFADAVSHAGETRYPVHIKLDTGMHRLGFMEEEIGRLCEVLPTLPAVKVASVFSHLNCADMPGEDAYTREQIARYDRMSAAVAASLPYSVIRHTANSAAIERFPEARFDMCRLGLGLYGFGWEHNAGLRPVSALKTRIVQIKRLEAGDAVGYGRAGKLLRPTVTATVPIGYADGLDRHLGCGRWSMCVAGRPAPIVGRVCMDSCMIDITDIPGVGEGDEVTVFSAEPGNDLETMARVLDTIPYEIMTSVSSRVKRIYLKE